MRALVIPVAKMSAVGVKKSYLIGGLLLIVLLLLPLFVKQPFYVHMLTLVLLYALLGGAWNILGGYTGQVSLGHAVYFGLGAYTSTILLMKLHLSPWLGMLAGGLVAVLLSVVLGYPCFKLKGHYFVIATIALGEIVATLFTDWAWAGGAAGIQIPLVKSSLTFFQFAGEPPYYYIALGLLLLQLVTTYLVGKSYLGYYFRAIKNDPEAARSLGINITFYKEAAMAFSAFFMAVGGTFYAQYVLFIDPGSVMPMMLSIQVCLIAIMGGVGTLWGPVIGAAIMIPLSELTSAYLGGGGSAIDLVVYGFLIMLIAVVKPSGIMGLFSRN